MASSRGRPLRQTTTCMRETATSWFFDTVTLSNFALTDSFGLLTARYGRSLCVTEPVRTELAVGRAQGYGGLGVVESALASRAITTVGPMGTAESELFVQLVRNLGAGESSCVACALLRGGVVATDDRAARVCCSLPYSCCLRLQTRGHAPRSLSGTPRTSIWVRCVTPPTTPRTWRMRWRRWGSK